MVDRPGAAGVRILDASGNPVTSATPLPVQAWLNVSLAAEDIQIGAVELKDRDQDVRATIRTIGAVCIELMTTSCQTLPVTTITANQIDIDDLTGSADNVGIATIQTASIPVNIMTVSAATIGITTITANQIDIDDLTGSSDNIGIATVQTASIPVNIVTFSGNTLPVNVVTFTAASVPVNIITVSAATIGITTISANQIDIDDLTGASDNVGIATIQTASIPVNITTISAGNYKASDYDTTATSEDVVQVVGLAIPGDGGAVQVNATNPLPVTFGATFDIQVGSVEIKSAADDSRANVTNGAIQMNLMTMSGATFPITTISAQQIDIDDLTGAADNVGIATIQTASIPVNVNTVSATGALGVTGTVSSIIATVTANYAQDYDTTATGSDPIPVSGLAIPGDGGHVKVDTTNPLPVTLPVATIAISTIAANQLDIDDLTGSSDNVGIATIQTASIPVNVNTISATGLLGITGTVNIASFSGATFPVTTISAQQIDIDDLTGSADNVGIATIQTASIPVNITTITATGIMGVTGTVSAEVVPLNTGVTSSVVVINTLAGATNPFTLPAATYAGRKTVIIYNRAETSTADLYIGGNAGATSTAGIVLAQGESLHLDLGTALIYAQGAVTLTTIAVMEAA